MNSSKYLSDEERSKLETFLISRIETDTRNAVMFLTALNTGARPIELLSLAWSDINLDNGDIFLRTVKKGRPRTVPVERYLIDALKLLKTISPSKPFDICYGHLAALWTLYRPVAKPLHCLRHTFAMYIYKAAKNKTADHLRFLQGALGHKNINNTLVYAEYEFNSEVYRKIMRVR